MINAKAINHIGIAVKSIDDAAPVLRDVLGAEFESIEDVPSQKVKVGFFKVGDVRLELLEPTDPYKQCGGISRKAGRGVAPRCVYSRRYRAAFVGIEVRRRETH